MQLSKTTHKYIFIIHKNKSLTLVNVCSVFQIQATDIDAAPNGQNVVYSCCQPGNDTQSLFTVSEEGRVIVAAENGLAGHIGTYQLTVTASDWGQPSRSGTATVTVHVDDFNDHTPELFVEGDKSTVVHRPEVCFDV